VAPLALWPGAGTGQGRSGLLRAHPLLDDGVLTGPAFGRKMAHGSLEHARPVGQVLGHGLSIAGFVDAARAWHLLDGLDTSPLYIDAGFGVRVNAPRFGGAIRIDVAHGLRGGGTTLSAGWGGEWPR
jgi:outer membrane translocation and assembly module TamA